MSPAIMRSYEYMSIFVKFYPATKQSQLSELMNHERSQSTKVYQVVSGNDSKLNTVSLTGFNR